MPAAATGSPGSASRPVVPRSASPRWALIVAGLHGAIAVALGAFAAHGMERAFPPRAVGWVETGSHYELVHAVALAAAAVLAGLAPGDGARRAVNAAVWGFALGPALFAGALYGLAFTGQGWFTAVAPFGGLAMILGWCALIVAGAAWAGGRDQDQA